MDIFLTIHNIIRWIVLLSGIWAVVGIFKNDRRGLRVYAISFDVQVLLGIILWINLILHKNFADVIKDFHLRFFIIEHPVIMLISFLSIHLAVIKSKNEGNVWKVLTVLSYVLLIVGIPWWRPLIRF